jgi:hypothetical protein
MLLHARRWNRHHHRLKIQGYASFILMVCSNGVQKLAASITRSRQGSCLSRSRCPESQQLIVDLEDERHKVAGDEGRSGIVVGRLRRAQHHRQR